MRGIESVMDRRTLFFSLSVAPVLALMAGMAAAAYGETMRIAAASSLSDAAEDLGAAFTRSTSIETTIIVASSSTLARQIAGGAAADVFLSADRNWADWLAGTGRLDAQSVAVFAGNRLVLAVPADAPIKAAGLEDCLKALKNGRIATGDPQHVPLGRYARDALQRQGVWDDVRSRLIPADNARAALRLVSSGQVAAGIVYASDAKAAGLNIAYVFPPADPPIAYVAGLVSAAPAGPRFLAFLTGGKAAPVLCDHGLTLPDDTPC
jgi:molybdate transport system substrate-binding protein